MAIGEPLQRLRVAVYSMEDPRSACAHLRLTAPLSALERQVETMWGARVIADRFQCAPDFASEADLVIVQRMFPRRETLPLIRKIAASGTPLIYELDDLLSEVPASNPNHVLTEALRPMMLETLRSASAVTTSCRTLAEVLRAYSADVSIVPNTVDPALLAASERARTRSRPPGPLVIAYVGTPTHGADLAGIEKALLALKQRHGSEIRFCLFGCPSKALAALPDTQTLPFQLDYSQYLAQLAALPLDLCVVPLAPTLFNRCKSAVKWLELSACSVAGVYADLEPYREVIEPGRTGLLAAHEPDAWYDALDRLIQDSALRERMARNAREQVRAEHTTPRASERLLQICERVSGRASAAALASPVRVTAGSGPGPRCSIVIPAYGRADLTEPCLRALTTLQERTSSEILVVDNASPDDTTSVLARFGERIRVIRNRENLGFARACNQGAAAARGRDLLFLNNDTVPLAGWLDALIDALDRVPGTGIVGSKLLYPDRTIQHAGVTICGSTGMPYHLYRGAPEHAQAVSWRRELQAVTAACMLVRGDLLRSLGGFDEAYRNGFEDVDLCLRARGQGERVIYEPRSVLFHLEEQTPGRKAHDPQNWAIFQQRFGDPAWSDEASQYAADGVHASTERDASSGASLRRFRPIEPAAREAWLRVIELQRRARDEGFASVADGLHDPATWPEHEELRRWAARLCAAHGRPDLAQRLAPAATWSATRPLAVAGPCTRAAQSPSPCAREPRAAGAQRDWEAAITSQLRLI